ncbi:histone deacetylase domain-containing protein [Phthorimaea operculella]|nr:histone deacetylase domain-containing protein [Phthorimaea operculella]
MQVRAASCTQVSYRAPHAPRLPGADTAFHHQIMQVRAASLYTIPGSPYRNWGIVKSSSGESITSPGAAATHPYRLAAPLPLAVHAAPAPSPNDYPLRKTASEPNMLKVRLKARVIERRASPLARRPLKTRVKHTNCETGSPRGSPPGGAAPIREEEESMARTPELLFSSPSMPNISLGRPHHAPPPRLAPPPPPVGVTLPPVSEAEAYTPITDGALGPGTVTGRLCKRPLGRTHSAPLPLGDPALHPHPHPPTAHHYLRDQIRKTVLTRAHDAAAAQLREEEGEVIDLTARRVDPAPPTPAVTAAPLARALSSPLVGARPPATGLAYDALMLKHGCACGANAPTHPEHGGRLQSVWARLCETGLAARTERTRPRKATLEELQSVHTEAHVAIFGGRPRDCRVEGAARQLVRLACGGLGVDSDTAWSDTHTAAAARMAAGAVLDLATRTARGELRNGFAVVRPPGHHAEPNQAMGFCFFNNVAVAARVLHTRLRLQRILIVDWVSSKRSTRIPQHNQAMGFCFFNNVAVAARVLHTRLRLQRILIVDWVSSKRSTRISQHNQAMGFCFFNNVAVAARVLHTRLRLQRILIVDWDVHHGNGTQQIFYEDPHVLYISIHRHDDGNFFPGTGAASECGAGAGLGYNVNIAWCSGTNPPLGDAEYLAAFRSIVMPIAKAYDPEIVLVSCGFDAANGHPAPLGGYNVSAACFAHMTRDLMQLANGKVVLSLEGGYDLPAMCDCAQECVRALLGERLPSPSPAELARAPHPPAQLALKQAVAVHQHHWPEIKRYADLIGMSAIEAGPAVAAARLGRLQTERDAADTAAAMATLSMHHANSATNLHTHTPSNHATDLRSAESSRSVSEEPMEQDADEGK